MRTLFPVLAMLALPDLAGGAVPGPGTIRAWEAYRARTEARLERERGAGSALAPTDATGTTVTVPGGLIHHWRAAMLLPRATLDDLLTRLQNPSERGPHPPDVLALRVVDRLPDGLRLFIRMTRQNIVTVTYDTVHDVTYRRDGPSRASSRSVAIRIAELEEAPSGLRARPPGEDRGFLWRLNAYWRYEQVAGGVLVELESISLSRDVPFGLGALVGPFIARIARESLTTALVGVRYTLDRPAPGRPAP